MIPVSDAVEEVIKRSPFLEEALSQDLINLSSLARKIRPELEKKLYKDLTVPSVMMALKRLSVRLKKKQSNFKPFLKNLGDITVRSNLVEYTFANSPSLIDCQHILLKEVIGQGNLFLTFSQGVFETTIFASSSLSPRIDIIFQNEELKAQFKNLSSITLTLPEEAVYTPGVYYTILKVLAWEGVSFIEVISSYTELTIFLERQFVEQAFSTLKNLV